MEKFWKKGACIDQKKNDAAEPDDLAQRGFLDFFAQGLVFGDYVLAQIMDFMAYIIDFITYLRNLLLHITAPIIDVLFCVFAQISDVLLGRNVRRLICLTNSDRHCPRL